MTLDAKFQVATGWYWKETDGVLFLCQYGAHATANGWLWVSTAFHGLDRVWYIPPTDPRPRYEEQVAPQNQSSTACTHRLLRWMGVVGESIGLRVEIIGSHQFPAVSSQQLRATGLS